MRSPSRRKVGVGKERADVTQDRGTRRLGNVHHVVGAFAQDRAGPDPVEVTYIPAGAAFFTTKGNSPSFGNYGFGTAVTFNVNRHIGVEGELGAMIATTSDLQFGDLNTSLKSPNLLSYSANLVVSPWSGHADRSVRDRRGVGGLTMFERPQLGIADEQTFLSRRRRRWHQVVLRRTIAGACAGDSGFGVTPGIRQRIRLHMPTTCHRPTPTGCSRS